MKAQELREMTVEDLRVKEKELVKELFNIRLQHSTTSLENPMRIGEIRRDIARVKTVLMEKRG
ncbi:MAG: 50S ribosomal protein L29 [Deltaproteobacteria bacterium]|nr:50S ribosomal protein L29 [Deltaproteobacteria bacterium]